MGEHGEQRRMVSAALEIVAIPAFADNYLWLVHEPICRETAVIDPGDGDAVLAAAAMRGWTINQVWNTHWHPDHTGGNAAVVAATGATLYAPSGETARIANIDVPLTEGSALRLGAVEGVAWETPGHTLGHLALVFADAGVAFVGDTIFAMGCGRLFEGSPEQMFHSLRRLTSLAPDTLLHPAHEYTLSNARFAVAAEPDNRAIADRLAKIEALRAEGAMTLPTTVADECATNPFVRAADVERFAELRAWKDRF